MGRSYCLLTDIFATCSPLKTESGDVTVAGPRDSQVEAPTYRYLL